MRRLPMQEKIVRVRRAVFPMQHAAEKRVFGSFRGSSMLPRRKPAR